MLQENDHVGVLCLLYICDFDAAMPVIACARAPKVKQEGLRCPAGSDTTLDRAHFSHFSV